MMKMKFQTSKNLLLATVLATTATTTLAGGTIKVGDNKSISAGIGVRTAFTAVNNGAPSGDAFSKDFAIQNARIYLSGQASKDIKFTFNTDEIFGQMGVLDAIIQYEPSKEFNVWVGRHLTPADRIEMNGPFYALSWNQYTVPLYSSDQLGAAGLYGRDDGITVWGTLGKFQYAVGAFDGLSGDKTANTDDNLLYAARFAYNLLNMEQNPAYYTSSTYYGGLGDILTVGLSVQQQTGGAGAVVDSADFMGYAVDVLFEKVLGNNVVTIEGEYKSFTADISAAAAADASNFPMFDGTSYFATAAFLYGSPIGKGKVQPYARMTGNSPSEGDSSSLTELGMNYILDGHNSRFNVNVTMGDADLTGAKGKDTKAVSFGMQQQF